MYKLLAIAAVGVVLLCLLLGYAAQLITLGPLPLIELTVAVCFLACFRHLRRVSSAFAALMLMMSLLWTITAVHLAVDIPAYGLIAMRDASHYIDMMAAVAGFCLFPYARKYLVRFPPMMYTASWLLIFAFVFRSVLQPILPTVRSYSGAEVSVLSFTAVVTTSVASAFCQMSFRHGRDRTFQVLFALLLIALVAQLMQARTIYLQILACSLLYYYLRPAHVRYLPVLALVAVGGMIAAAPLGEQFGRLGVAIDAGSLVDHILAIFGVTSSNFEGSASGIWQRLDWWSTVYDRVTGSAVTALFGLGFGVPLTDFEVVYNVTAREVHNSTVSAFARVGSIGVALVLAIWILAVRVFLKVLAQVKAGTLPPQDRRLVVFLAYLVTSIWVFSFGEDAFEKPFNAVPFYFALGVACAVLQRVGQRAGARQVQADAGQRTSFGAPSTGLFGRHVAP